MEGEKARERERERERENHAHVCVLHCRILLYLLLSIELGSGWDGVPCVVVTLGSSRICLCMDKRERGEVVSRSDRGGVRVFDV